MTDLKQAEQKALERLEACVCPPSVQRDIINPLGSALGQQQAEPVQERSNGMPTSKVERNLRRMLCVERHGGSAYLDDGEASYCGDAYYRSIDYMRESIGSIMRAWYDAGAKKLAAAQAQEQAEPVAWELRKGKTDRVLFEITNNPNRARDWESSLEEVVPLYTKQPCRKPLTREQRKALIESAINACDEEGLLPDMERFAWMIDAVERAHRIGENK